jgi:hypothetical protein
MHVSRPDDTHPPALSGAPGDVFGLQRTARESVPHSLQGWSSSRRVTIAWVEPTAGIRRITRKDVIAPGFETALARPRHQAHLEEALDRTADVRTACCHNLQDCIWP